MNSPNVREPLTVVQVREPLTAEQAEQIRHAFRASVGDDRPMLLAGPDVTVRLLEPDRRARVFAYAACAFAFLALLVAIWAVTM